MGLMNQAYDTYCSLEAKYAGQYLSELKEPLVPVSHQIASGDIEITLSSAGDFLSARAMDKASIIIPVTEQSAGRTGDTSCAHPLCDQIRFLTPQYPEKYSAYLTQLHAWENSAYSHPKLHAIARYVEKGTILADLQHCGLISVNEQGLPEKEKLVVCWCIESGNAAELSECYRDRALFQAFSNYYASVKQERHAFCMVSGKDTVLASQHPKKIIVSGKKANAKLISANDSAGFTYRGRFTDDIQAATVGYEASQKIHNAIHWLAANQGVVLGGRTFLCWNPKGIELPKANAPLMRKNTPPQIKYSDYRKALQESLCGWQEHIPKDAGAVIAAFDAATSGRLSLTYYSELIASDFLQRLHDWDASCCWLNYPFGIQSPSMFQIVNCAFGTPRMIKNQMQFETDERVLRQQIQRLISCRIDKAKFPGDMVKSIVAKASTMYLLDKDLRKTLLFTACAVIRKYHYDRYQEEWEMALDPTKKDISYQYGRLLAVFEKVEKDTYDKTETRETNAIRMLPVYVNRPRHVSCELWTKLQTAYFPRIKNQKAKNQYHIIIAQIMEQLSAFTEQEQARPLGDTYLMGYYLQRNELYQPKAKENEQEEKA